MFWHSDLPVSGREEFAYIEAFLLSQPPRWTEACCASFAGIIGWHLRNR
jgi:hypothetical protein